MTDDAIRMALHKEHGKRIALVVRWFPNPSETFVVRRVLELLDRGWDVHVICDATLAKDWRMFPELADRPSIRRRVHPAAQVFTYADILLRLPGALARTGLRNPRGTLRYLTRGWRLYRRRVIRRFVEEAVLVRLGPDLLHFEFGHLFVGREAAGELLDCAVVVSFQGYDLNYVGLDEEPGYYTEAWKRADAVHFVSRDLEERAGRRGFPKDGPGFVVLNGVDATLFDRGERGTLDVVGTAARPVRVLSVGRLHWKKGYEYALRAIRMLIDAGVACDYRIVGEGDFREALLYTVADLGLENVVTLVGPLPHHQIPDQMVWADVFLHAAVSEGFCLAVAEAQAMQLPVVTSDADGLAENVIDGETGFVVGRRDANAMARRLKELSGDPRMRDRLGRAGRRHVRTQFPMETHIGGIEKVYASALARRCRQDVIVRC